MKSAVNGRLARLFLLLAFLLLLPAASAACGGGGNAGPAEFEILDFGPDDPADDIDYQLQLARQNAAQGLTFEPEKLVRVSAVYNNQVRLERLQQVNRDLVTLLDYSNPGEIDLDWVIRVHQAVEDADRLYSEAVGYRLPEDLVEDFGDYYVEVLETVQLSGYGASRLLAAAVEVGPDGRSLLNFTDNERRRFDVLMREARFYLRGSEDSFKELTKELSSLESSLHTR